MRALALVLALSGCSMALGVGGTKDPKKADRQVGCSPVLPVVDSALAVAGLVAGGVIIAQRRDEPSSEYAPNNEIGGILAAVAGLLYAGSAIGGFREYSSCGSEPMSGIAAK